MLLHDEPTVPGSCSPACRAQCVRNFPAQMWSGRCCVTAAVPDRRVQPTACAPVRYHFAAHQRPHRCIHSTERLLGSQPKARFLCRCSKARGRASVAHGRGLQCHRSLAYGANSGSSCGAAPWRRRVSMEPCTALPSPAASESVAREKWQAGSARRNAVRSMRSLLTQTAQRDPRGLAAALETATLRARGVACCEPPC